MTSEHSSGERVPENGELVDFLKKDIVSSAQSRPKKVKLTMPEFLSLLRKEPNQSLLSHAKIYSVIKGADYEEIRQESDPRRAKVLGIAQDEVMRVPKFFKGFYGIEETLVEIEKYFFAAAGLGEESRQVLYLVGPPSSGKSTLAECIRKGLEKHGFWEIEGCPQHDSPANATPRHIREELLARFGIFIHPRADICPICRWKLRNELENDYLRFTIQWRSFSQRGDCGIAVVSEVDPINFDIGTFIGTEDIALLGQYSRGDPRTFVLRGAYSRGSQGMTEIVEIWKNPPEANRTIITVTQEKYVPAPKFTGQNYIDTAVIAHSNESEWNKFRADQSNEAILNRIKILRAPLNLRLTEEVMIYKSFLSKSTMFRNIHIDPHALEQAAMFALLTRLAPSNKVDALTKLKLHDGQTVLEKGRIKKVSLKELKEEAGLREGMVGISYRDIAKNIIEESLAARRDQWEVDPYLREHGGYLNGLWIRDAMIKLVQQLDVPEDADWPKPSKKRWLGFIQDTLHKEFLRVLDTDITEAFIIAFEEQAEAMFQKYLDHLLAFVNKKKVKDRSTREELEPDIKFLESIEQPIGVVGSAADTFRHEVAATLLDLQRSGERITWKVYEPLREAIEEKLKASVKDIVRVIVRTRIRDDVQQRKYDAMVEELKRKGYAESGIEIILRYAENNLWRD